MFTLIVNCILLGIVVIYVVAYIPILLRAAMRACVEIIRIIVRATRWLMHRSD